MSNAERIAQLEALQRRARASANVLFQQPRGKAIATRKALHRDMLESYVLALDAVARELDELDSDPDASVRYYRVTGATPDSIDYINQLIATSAPRTFAARLSECVWDAIRECLPRDIESDCEDPRLRHALTHADRMFHVGVRVLEDHVALLRDLAGEPVDGDLPRLNPVRFGEFGHHAIHVGENESYDLDVIREKLCDHDLFSASRSFRPVHDELHAGPIGPIRSLKDFYGYDRERRFFEQYFADFVAGKETPPLLLSGMPGIGKTHLTIAYSLSLPSLTLVMGDQSYLEESLEWLVDILGQHHYRQFVLFFDDVEADRVNWTTFRNQVDGFLPFSTNVAIVIAANEPFPVPIRSRCRNFEFRQMDPEVCQEFIADYLEAHRWMSQPYPDLVSTVASDFVSMYKRQVISELTPRSLVKYLEMLEADKNKIKKLVRESLEDVIRVPSEEAFIESNRTIINQLRLSRGEKPLPDPAASAAGPPLPNDFPE